MASSRIYQGIPLSSGDTVLLDRKATHHLRNVLRMRSGQKVILFNGDNNEYTATLEICGKDIRATVIGVWSSNRESPLHLTLVQGISRSDRMSWSIQKAVELGVAEIIPVYCEHSAKSFNKTHAEKKTRHLQGIIISACEQSGRCVIPKLETMRTLDEYFDSRSRSTSGYVLDPDAGYSANEITSIDDKIDVLVGPEGGLSRRETDLAVRAGLQAIKLGPRILRTETAGVAILSILQSKFAEIEAYIPELPVLVTYAVQFL